MSKALEALKQMGFYRLEMGVNVIDLPNYEIIETALKEKAQQDSVLKTLKEVIAFAKKLPDIEFDDDGNIQGIFGAVGMNIQRQMENKERELLRKWVLETCFPKELKALEIFKKLDFEIEDYTKDTYGSIRVNRSWIILDDEEIDIAKEVLL